ncbi:MAG: hypothetical protein ACLTXL_09930 [Clostridia bacterium]|jgi:hypothetical protein
MGKNRRADAVLFGFDFQVNAAIVLMLENIKELQSLRLESNNDCWQNYASDFEGSCMDPDIVEALSKVVVYNVIRRRYDIDRIKKGVSL